MNRIHIVGASPRSGTTLLAEAMIACLNIDLHTDHEDRIFISPTEECNIFLTKCPQDVMVVGPRLWLDPRLYVIYIVRDPRDIIVSRHGVNPNVYWCGLNFWKTYTPYGRTIQHHRRCITIRYEDLVSDPDAVQEELIHELPFLEKGTRFSQYHVVAAPSSASQDALRGIRPITPDSVGRWRNHLPRIVGQLKRHGSITDDLIEFGYESDDSWLSELEGVEADFSESALPESFSEEEIEGKLRGRYREVIKAFVRMAGLDPSKVRKWFSLHHQV